MSKKEDKKKEETKLGDEVEKIIKKLVPSYYAKKRKCKKCMKRKQWLNNIGGVFK